MSGAGKSYYSEYIKKILEKENLKVNIIDDIIRDKYKIPVGFIFDEIVTIIKTLRIHVKKNIKILMLP